MRMTDEEEAWVAHTTLDLNDVLQTFGADGANMILEHLSSEAKDILVRALVVKY